MHIIRGYLAMAVLSMLLSTGVLLTLEATNPRFHITETYFVRAPAAQGGGMHRESRPTNGATELWLGVSLITFTAGAVISGRFW